jgi:SPP1 family predicted phage head-tail adaptor
MTAGRLDRRIELLRATTTYDSFNAPIATWATLQKVWAEAKPVLDGEKQQAGQTLASKSYRFTIRYSSDVADLDPRDRLLFDGRTYEINAVKEMDRRRWLEITATAKAETP